ncbi:MAG TPA: PspC domain-containing protein [bacterium]|nr:PspC domain-containing protein [bacterium]
MRKFYRKKEGKKIAGVCSGLGEYFNIDPTLIRVVFIISIFLSGLGLLVYLILWIASSPENY